MATKKVRIIDLTERHNGDARYGQANDGSWYDRKDARFVFPEQTIRTEQKVQAA